MTYTQYKNNFSTLKLKNSDAFFIVRSLVQNSDLFFRSVVNYKNLVLNYPCSLRRSSTDTNKLGAYGTNK